MGWKKIGEEAQVQTGWKKIGEGEPTPDNIDPSIENQTQQQEPIKAPTSSTNMLNFGTDKQVEEDIKTKPIVEPIKPKPIVPWNDIMEGNLNQPKKEPTLAPISELESIRTPEEQAHEEWKANTLKKANDAAHTLATDVVSNQEILPHYQNNLKSIPFDQPGSVVHDISDFHGNPEMTGQYTTHRVEQLKIQRDAALANLPNQDPMGYGLNNAYIRKTKADYDQKIQKIQDAGNYIMDLQLANKEHIKVPEIGGVDIRTSQDKFSEITKQKDKDIAKVESNYNDKKEKILNDTPHGGLTRPADLSQLDTDKENEIKKINAKYDLARTANHITERNTLFDPAKIGLQKASILGSEQAKQDMIAYNNGQNIPQERLFTYESLGKRAIQTATEAVAASGNTHVASNLYQYAKAADKKISTDNPEFIQNQKLSELGNHLYEQRNALHGGFLYSQPHFNQEDMEGAADEMGWDKDTIKGLNPNDIPTAPGMANKVIQGAINTGILSTGESLDRWGSDLFSLIAGAGTNGIPTNDLFNKWADKNQQRIKETYTPGWENKSSLGSYFTGKVPDAYEQPHDLRSVLGAMAQGAGDLAGMYGPLSGIKLAGGAMGVEKAIQAATTAGDISKAQKIAHAAEINYNSVYGALTSYNTGYEQSLSIIGDKPEDEFKRRAYATTIGLIGGAVMRIDPQGVLGKNAVGAVAEAFNKTEGGKAFIKSLDKGLVGITEVADAKKSIIQALPEIGKHLGLQITMPVAQTMGTNIVDMIADPNHKHDLTDNVKQAAISGGIAMFIPSIAAGLNEHKAVTNEVNKGLTYEIATDPNKYRDVLKDLLQKDQITPQQKENAITIISHIEGIGNLYEGDKVKKINGDPLSESEKKELIYLELRQNVKQQQLENPNLPEVYKSQIKDEINDLKKQSLNILAKGYKQPIAPPPPVQQESSDDVKKDFISLEKQRMKILGFHDNIINEEVDKINKTDDISEHLNDAIETVNGHVNHFRVRAKMTKSKIDKEYLLSAMKENQYQLNKYTALKDRLKIIADNKAKEGSNINNQNQNPIQNGKSSEVQENVETNDKTNEGENNGGHEENHDTNELQGDRLRNEVTQSTGTQEQGDEVSVVPAPPDKAATEKTDEELLAEFNASNDNKTPSDKPVTPTELQPITPESKKYSPLEAINTGDLGGKPKEEGIKTIKEAGLDDKLGNTGETIRQGIDRTIQGFKDLKNKAKANSSQITHSGLIKIFKAWKELGEPDKLSESDYKKIAEAYKTASDGTKDGEILNWKNKDGEPIFIARHTESEDGKNGLMRRPETPLTEKGKDDAKILAQKLKEKGADINEVHSDDLERTKQTSEIVKEHLKSNEDEGKPFVTRIHININSEEGVRDLEKIYNPHYDLGDITDEEHPLYAQSEIVSDVMNNAKITDEDYNKLVELRDKYLNEDGSLDYAGIADEVNSLDLSPSAKELAQKIGMFSDIPENKPHIDNLLNEIYEYERTNTKVAEGIGSEGDANRIGELQPKQSSAASKEEPINQPQYRKASQRLRDYADKLEAIQKERGGVRNDLFGIKGGDAGIVRYIADLVENFENIHLAIRKTIEHFGIKDEKNIQALKDHVGFMDKHINPQDDPTLSEKQKLIIAELANRRLNKINNDPNLFEKEMDAIHENKSIEDKVKNHIADQISYEFKAPIEEKAAKDNFIEETRIGNEESLSRRLSMETDADVWEDEEALSRGEISKVALDLEEFNKAGQDILQKAQFKFADRSTDPLIYGDKLLNALKKVKLIDEEGTLKDHNIRLKMAGLQALDGAIQLEIRKERGKANPDMARIEQLTNLLQKVETPIRDLASTASNIMNERRALRLMRNEYMAEHYAEKIHSEDDRAKAASLEQEINKKVPISEDIQQQIKDRVSIEVKEQMAKLKEMAAKEAKEKVETPEQTAKREAKEKLAAEKVETPEQASRRADREQAAKEKSKAKEEQEKNLKKNQDAAKKELRKSGETREKLQSKLQDSINRFKDLMTKNPCK